MGLLNVDNFLLLSIGKFWPIWTVEEHLNYRLFNPKLYPRFFNPRFFNHDFLNHWVEKSRVEKSRVEMFFQLMVRGHFNPGLFHPRLFNYEVFNSMVQKFIFEKSGVEKFMVEKSGVERCCVEAWGWEVRSWYICLFNLFNSSFCAKFFYGWLLKEEMSKQFLTGHVCHCLSSSACT